MAVSKNYNELLFLVFAVMAQREQLLKAQTEKTQYKFCPLNVVKQYNGNLQIWNLF